MAGILAVGYGVACYAVFFATFLYAIAFVGNIGVPKGIDTGAVDLGAGPVILNVLLLAVFAVQHSVMARRGFKRMWTRIVHPAVERSTFVLFSTAALALVLWQWQAIGGVVWSVQSPAGVIVLWALFALGWCVLLLSTFMIDHFDLFGLRQVVLFARGVPCTPPDFRTRGLYSHIRHPIMLGFLFGFWATPHMTVGHLLFAIGTTGYILVGIAFEERDLLHFYGEKYRAYRLTVPMLIPGLGRLRRTEIGRETGK